MVYTQDDFFRVIGHICVLFSTWDLFTTLLITRLAKTERSLHQLERMPLGAKLTLLSRLRADDVVDVGLLQKIKDALPEACRVGTQRNRFIHDQWLFDPESVRRGVLTLYSLKVVGESEQLGISLCPTKQFSLEDLRIFSSEVGEQQKRFAAWAGVRPT